MEGAGRDGLDATARHPRLQHGWRDHNRGGHTTSDRYASTPTDLPMSTPVPTSTPEPTPTAIPTFFEVEDPSNDGLNCTDGTLITLDTPLDVDITNVHVVVVPDYLVLRITLGNAQALTNPLWGGVEFFDTSMENSPTDPNWFFNGRGNRNFAFSYSQPNVVPQLHIFDPAHGGWYTEKNTGFMGRVEGNQIIIEIPITEIPLDSPFNVSITNFSYCDEVGLTPDGVPELFPPPLG